MTCMDNRQTDQLKNSKHPPRLTNQDFALRYNVMYSGTYYDQVLQCILYIKPRTSGYATWFTARGAIRIAHYDVNDDVITRKL